MHKPLDQSNLHPEAPKGLELSAEWGEYGNRISDDFEKSVEEGLWMGEPPDHHVVSVGSYNGKPALFTRNLYASECDMRLWDGGSFPKTLQVCSNLFAYPLKHDPAEVTHFDEWIFVYEKILKNDGKYDIYSDQIPAEFLWTIDEMTGCDEQITGDEIRLDEFIEKEIGGLNKIIASKVREIVKRKLIKPL